MIDLATTYLGLSLRSPIVASPSPLTGDVDALVALQAAGVGAVVLPSLFEEQIVHESMAVHDLLETGAGAFAEATSGFVPELDDYNTGPTRYLRLVEAASSRLDVPVIASLNGVTRGGWTGYARSMASAGAAAIELNVYRIAADPTVTGRQVEDELIDLVGEVRASVDVPLAVKLGPSWSSLGHLAPRLADNGADGLVLFNRFYQPDLDLETLRVVPSLHLSGPEELRLPLRWVAMLAGRIDASLAITSGVAGWQEVTKALLAGADVAMTTSAVLRHGPGIVAEMLHGLERWMLEREYVSVAQLRGAMSQASVADPSRYERANYIDTLTTYASVHR